MSSRTHLRGDESSGHWRLAGRADYSFQPTDLVNGAFLRLLKGDRRIDAKDLAHLKNLISRTLLHEFLDRLAAGQTIKRGSGERPTSIDVEALLAPDHRWNLEELYALGEALRKLSEVRPRGAEIVTLKLLEGLTWPEIAERLDENASVVRRQFAVAKLWLATALR